MQILKDEIRNRIHASAIKEFREKGYEGTSMRNIAKLSGITVGNLYRYFKNKEDLFYNVISPAYEKIKWLATDFKSDNFDFSALNYIEGYYEVEKIQREHRDELLILIDGSSGTKYQSARNDIISMLEGRLRKILEKGEKWSKEECKNSILPRVISTSLIEGFIVIMRECRDDERIKQNIKQYIEIFVRSSIEALIR